MVTLNEQLLKREINQLRERIEAAIKNLKQKVDPSLVIAQDLTSALDTISYLESYV